MRLSRSARQWEKLRVVYVDDGSTDKSLLILREIAAHDSRSRYRYAAITGEPAAMSANLTRRRRDFDSRWTPVTDQKDITRLLEKN